MEGYYGVELSKYFKFNCAHFVVYKDFREPLHGHNYKVSIEIKSKNMNSSYYVVDFKIVNNLMNEICDGLRDHLLLPNKNKFVNITQDENNVIVKCEDSEFSFPNKDVIILDTEQISAECLSKYITHLFLDRFKEKYENNFNEINIKKIKVKVYEDVGKCGIYNLKFL